MKTLIIIAWRNLWRNKRRSLITMGSIFMAVLLAVFMRSMQKGSYENMTMAAISQVGYMQVQGKGYWNNQSINKAIVYTQKLKQDIQTVPNIKNQTPRLQNFILASSGEKTKGAQVNGIIPTVENAHNGLAKKIILGNYLSKSDNGVLIAEGLARYLGIIKYDTIPGSNPDSVKTQIKLVSDTLTIIGSGYQGITAAGIYPVKGILKFPTPQENGGLIYMTLQEAQNLFSPYVPNLVTSVAIDISDRSKINQTQTQLQKVIGNNYDVMLWNEMLKELVQSIQSDNVSGIVMLGILYMIVGFGLLGTVLMMTMERKREMAVMLAVGMQRTRLAGFLAIESIILGIIGVVAGMAISFPVILYLNLHPIPLQGDMANMMATYNMEPILPFAMNAPIFLNQAAVIFGITLIVAFYPIITAFRLKIIQAFHK